MPPQNTGTIRRNINLGLEGGGTLLTRDHRGAGFNTPGDQRRYVITADRFVCADESGPDWIGSDEPQWVFTTKLEGEDPVTHVSSEFGSVDSGDEREFNGDDGDIAPARNDPDVSVAAPVGASIQLIEVDQGKNYKQIVEKVFQAAEWLPSVGQWVAKTPDTVRDHIADVIGDDLMGSNTIFFRPHDLERNLPTIGSSFVQKIYFGGQGGDLPFAVAGGPDYYLYLKVERAEDAA